MKLTTTATHAMSFLLFAASTMGLSAETPKTQKLTPPMYCTNIEKACEAAGFHKFGHKVNDGLWKSCMEPILSGNTVDKVTVDQADVKGCQQLRAKHTTSTTTSTGNH